MPALVASLSVVLLAACSDGAGPDAQPSSGASSAPPAAVSTTAPSASYVVERGDTLSAIAKRYGITVESIVAANQLASRDQLTEGQTLVIPPRTAVQLAVSPSDGQPGASIQFTLSGAQASETITFEVASPSGTTFTGPPHTASPEGSVTAKYQTTPQNPAGTYAVAAKGSEGTTAQSEFRLNPPPASSTLN
jgi:LysM repeat protein